MWEEDVSDPGEASSPVYARERRRGCLACTDMSCWRSMGCAGCCDENGCEECLGEDGCCGCLLCLDDCGCTETCEDGGCCRCDTCSRACGCDALGASCWACLTCEMDPPSDGAGGSRAVGVMGNKWVLFLLGSFLVLWSGAMITFVDFATDLFADRWHYTPAQAGRTTSLLTLCAIVLMVPVGALLDATGQVGGLLVGGSSVTALGIGLLWLLPVLPPEWGALLIGVGAAVVSAVLWPALGQVIPAGSRGSVLGLLLCLQNLVLCFGPMALGVLRDAGGGYDEALVIFAGLVCVCVFLCGALLVAWQRAMGQDVKKGA